MICCLPILPILSVTEQSVLNSPTMMEDLSISFSSEEFFLFTYFRIILLAINLGLLCLPVEMTLPSNTFYLDV